MLKAPDWDALAPYWHCFENVGLSKTILSALKPYLNLPILYIGGGRGTYPAFLRNWVGQENLAVVDSSPRMAQRAYIDFNLKYVVSDARDLPFSDQSFGSVVCATGVLEFLDLSEQKKALKEMARICLPKGSLLVTVFYHEYFRSEFTAHASHNEPPVTYQQPDLLDRWFQHQSSLLPGEKRIAASFSIVAREMGDRTAAYQLLRHSLSTSEGTIHLETFPYTARDVGLECKLLKLFVEKKVAIWNLSALRETTIE